ncbi:MAG: hypothetical protein ACRDQB_18135, partial [Thermocrispum sp.]
AGTKVKIGAAIASTAVAGVLGLSAGPVISDAAVDVLGLQGQQGVNHVEPTIQRATGGDASSIGEKSLRHAERKRGNGAWGLPKEQDDERSGVSSTSGESAPAATDELVGGVKGDLPMNQQDAPSALDEVTTEASQDKSPGARKPQDGSEGRKPKPGTGGGKESDKPTSSPAPEEPQASTWDDVAHDCVDDYEYYETYNASEGRTETYEYSYVNGEGYETTTYHYDYGDTYSTTYYWYDEC